MQRRKSQLKSTSNAKQKTCAFLCNRPHIPSNQQAAEVLRLELDYAIRRSIFQGYTIFLSGMTLGTEIIAAELVLKIRDEFPHICLHCYLPYEGQANKWSECWRERYFDALANADEVICLQAQYLPGCQEERQRLMTVRSSKLIVIPDDSKTCNDNNEILSIINFPKAREESDIPGRPIASK